MSDDTAALVRMIESVNRKLAMLISVIPWDAVLDPQALEDEITAANAELTTARGELGL